MAEEGKTATMESADDAQLGPEVLFVTDTSEKDWRGGLSPKTRRTSICAF